MISLPSFLAEVGQPLFGSPWLALGVVLIGVAALMAAIAYVGHVLAATHPSTAKAAPIPVVPAVTAPPAARAATGSELSTEQVTVLIAASVAAVLGRGARVVSVKPATSVEMLMQQWSLEGRRQIYSSHQFR
jgi:hypothetical protein